MIAQNRKLMEDIQYRVRKADAAQFPPADLLEDEAGACETAAGGAVK